MTTGPPRRVWVDLTNSPHVLVLAPIIRRLRAAGHDVQVTARDFAQTIELAERHGLGAVELGRHGGAGRAGRARALASRSLEAYRFARGRAFDVAVGHGSNDLPIAARALRIPAVDMFDYEWALLQHTVGCRLSRRVLVPDAIPRERLRRYGASGDKLRAVPGPQGGVLPLATSSPTRPRSTALGADGSRLVAVVRTPPELALYHPGSDDLFAAVVDRLGNDPDVHAVVLPRTREQGSAAAAARRCRR